ncbi:MAG: hypothetical protein ACREE9_09515 [Stellaceae bacterium]
MRLLGWLGGKDVRQRSGTLPIEMPRLVLDRAGAEAASLDALRRGDFVQASVIVVSVEAASNRPRGLNVTWDDIEADRLAEGVAEIFSVVPGIFAGMHEAALSALRLAAGMQCLWGDSRSCRWLPNGLETGIPLGAEPAARMLMFCAQHKIKLRQWISSDVVKRVEICDAGEDSCVECHKLHQRRYRFGALPELPNPRCTHPMGCRCVYLPIT